MTNHSAGQHGLKKGLGCDEHAVLKWYVRNVKHNEYARIRRKIVSFYHECRF